MTGLRSSKHLVIGESLLRGLTPSEEHTSINLSRANFVRPSGLVAVMCLASAAIRAGRRVSFTPPPFDTGASGYLYRMRLHEHLEELGITPNLRRVKFHDTGNNLYELDSFSTSEGAGRLATQVFDLGRSAGFDDAAARSLYTVVQEAAGNVVEHSDPQGSPRGYIALQSYRRAGSVEFAIGDPGIGLRASLSEKHDVSDDQQSVELAMQYGVSGTGRTGRGRGLVIMRRTAGMEFSLSSGRSCFTSRSTGERWLTAPPGTALPGTMVTGTFLAYASED